MRLEGLIDYGSVLELTEDKRVAYARYIVALSDEVHTPRTNFGYIDRAERKSSAQRLICFENPVVVFVCEEPFG